MAAAPDNRRFQLLGPLRAELDGDEVPIVGRKPRTLLALLLLRAGGLVSRDELIDLLWPENPPETAANTIQVYVSQLRRALGPELVRTEGNGYVLTADRETIDVHRFDRLVEEAHRPRVKPETAVRLLDEALSLWHGQPLPDLPAEGARLSALRLQALGRRIDAELELGRHAEVLAELESLTRNEPFREQFTAQLMIALYRSGRQAEALEAFQRLRATLGEELGLEPTPELRDLERAILNQAPSLAAGRSPSTGLLSELRKPVTVLAATFTRGRELDVEVEAHVADRIAVHAARIVAEHDGTVLPTVDGTLVAVFGLPYAHEDDARRAAHAALELERGLPGLRDDLGAELVPELHLRAAIGTTIAVVPAPEQGASSLPAAMAASAVALVRTAPEGTILLDATTRALIRNAAATDPVDDPAHGGPVWRLRGLRAERGADASPFVGRRDELEQLEAAFCSAVETERVVERRIVGRAGIGKTRLVDELVSSLGDEAQVLRAACRAGLRGVAVLRALVARTPVEVPDGADVVPAVARALTELATTRPVVAILDDFELADTELLQAARDLAAQSEGPILFLTLTRRRGDHEAAFVVEPLPPADARRLADRLLELRVDAPVREQVAAAGEGNPFFIEQLAASVAEGAALSPIPPTIQALLAARLERLTPEERRLHQAGAIVGQTFTIADATAVLAAASGSLEPVLAALERRRLVAPGEAGAWTFRHALLWEAAYASIPKRDRSPLHERAARIPSSGKQATALHLEQAWRLREELGDSSADVDRLREETVSALLAAGEEAFARVDVHAARSLLGRAAELMRPDDSRRGALLVDLAETLRGGGEPRAALAKLDDLAGVQHVDPLVQAQADLVRMRIVHLVDNAAPTDEALTRLDSALQLFEEAADHARLADGWFLRAWFDWLLCRAGPADAALDRSVEHARKAHDRRLEGNAIHLKVGAILHGPRPVEDGIGICRRLLDEFADEPRIVASASRGLAGLLAMQGRFAEAHEQIARDRELVDQLGLRIAAAAGTELYAFVHLLEGDLRAAESELRAGCAAFEEMGESNSLSTLSAALAQVRWRRGDVDETLELATRASELAADDDIHTQVQARGPQAKALAALGRLPEAELVAREGVELGEATDFLPMRALAALDLAEVLLFARREEDALEAASDAARLYEAKGFVVGAGAACDFVTGLDSKPRPRAGRGAPRTAA
jgi:DNA-binding SARP family transcriptional activator